MLPERVQLARVVARAALAGVGFGWGSRWAGVGVLFAQPATVFLSDPFRYLYRDADIEVRREWELRRVVGGI